MHSPIRLEKARQPPCFLLHVLERPRIARLICVHPQRLRRSRAGARLGNRSEILTKHTLLLLKFRVNLVASGLGEAIASQSPREDVEVYMRHGLTRRATVLRDRIHPKSSAKMKKKKKGREREKKSGGSVIVSHLTRKGEPIRLVCALDDAPDALDGAHELRELVRAEVGEAWDGARRAHEHVWKNKTSKKVYLFYGLFLLKKSR